jgi:HSP20 family protein
MPLIPWKQFLDLDKFFGDDEFFFPVFSRSEFVKPAMDLKETEKDIIAEIEAPGFDPKNIDISIDNGILKVKGILDEKKEEKNEKGYWRKEIRKSSFERTIRLPVAVKENEAKAIYENGVLKISIPKIEQSTSSKIKIQVQEK